MSNDTGNTPYIRAMLGLRRSNATVPKPKRTVRKARSRSGARRKAIKEH